MDLNDYRAPSSELVRIASQYALMPKAFTTGLDTGERDRHISLRMAERCDRITALDLMVQNISQENFACVRDTNSAPESAQQSEIDWVHGFPSYFAESYATWQLGANENTNGLGRQSRLKVSPVDTVTDR